jgi:glyoxylase-like metal-dependent hydrolase (beta-lactamase superfamily II)
MATKLTAGERGDAGEVWWLDLGSVNAYLLVDGGDLALVDAGMPRHADRVREGVRAAGYALADVDRVLVTHYDYDHVGGLARLAPDLDAPVVAGQPDADYLVGRRRPPLSNHKALLQRVTRPLLDRPPRRVEPVSDGVRVGSVTVYATPGHTPGHVAYVSEHLGVAFLGDLVRSTDGGLSASPWYISYDAAAVRRSVRDLAARAPDFEVACPGHGPPLRSGGADALARLTAPP